MPINGGKYVPFFKANVTEPPPLLPSIKRIYDVPTSVIGRVTINNLLICLPVESSAYEPVVLCIATDIVNTLPQHRNSKVQYLTDLPQTAPSAWPARIEKSSAAITTSLAFTLAIPDMKLAGLYSMGFPFSSYFPLPAVLPISRKDC